MRTVQEREVRWLFDEVWPLMELAAVHRDLCIKNLGTINEVLANHANPNAALVALACISGIKWVLASGLLFISAPDSLVPFDKYTMGWALEHRIIRDHRISRGTYVDSCRRIHAYIASMEPPRTIIQFVREAGVNASMPFSPE